MNLLLFILPSNSKWISPLALTAEIMLTVNLAPVLATTGVRPRGAQVVPEWWSDRSDASSSKILMPLAVRSRVVETGGASLADVEVSWRG